MAGNWVFALSEGRGCPAPGAFTSRSGTGEGLVRRRDRASGRALKDGALRNEINLTTVEMASRSAGTANASPAARVGREHVGGEQ
jgi:hypothetical protein